MRWGGRYLDCLDSLDEDAVEEGDETFDGFDGERLRAGWEVSERSGWARVMTVTMIRMINERREIC